MNIASLNVCGLRHRILYPDFCDLVARYDIFCVSETKLDNFDIIDIPCFDFVSQVRKQKYLRKSGGIGVFINKSISKQVTVLYSESDYILWLKINKGTLQNDDDLYLGAVYVPPHDSRFNTADEMSLFEVEITNMAIAHKYVLLMGDFNARTHNKPDFIDADDFLVTILNMMIVY